MQHRYQIVDGKLTETQEENCPIAIYVSPDNGEKNCLVNEIKIDEHTLASALDPDELSRLEFEPGHAALIFKRPKHYSAKDEFIFKVASTGAFLFKDRLIIIVSEDVSLFDNMKVGTMNSPRAIILKLLYGSIYHFREHLKIINAISDELQHKINMAMENLHLIHLFALQKSLVYYLNSINSNAALIDKLKHNSAKIGFTPEEMETIDDISVENNQCLKQAEIYSNILASLMDARASIVSNNLNVLMKTLTLITICIMVPTLVVSMFSMNVHIPLEDRHYAFYVIMALAFLSVVTFLFVWRHRR